MTEEGKSTVKSELSARTDPQASALVSTADRTQSTANWSFVKVLIAQHELWLSQNENMQSDYTWSEMIPLPVISFWNGDN